MGSYNKFNPSGKYRISKKLVFRFFENTVKIHNLVTNKLIIFNEVATDLWRVISNIEDFSVENLIQFLKDSYGLENLDSYQTDVLNFLEQTYIEGLISQDDSFFEVSIRDTPKDDLSHHLINLNYDLNKLLKNENGLNSATFELTYKCNEKCMHCYINQSNNEQLDTKTWFRIIDELVEMNAMYLTFTGGEPLLRKDFLEIYYYAFEKNFAIDIYTNGLLINEEFLTLFKNMPPRAFYISLYSMDETVHDSVTKIPGSFKSTVDAILKLKEICPNIVLNIPVMTLNQGCIEDILSWAGENQLFYKISFNMTNTNDGSSEPLRFQINDKNQVFKILSKINYKNPDEPSLFTHVCGAGKSSISIRPNGIVQACVGLTKPIGDIKVNSIKQIWQNSIELDEIRKVTWAESSDCKDCSIKNHCNHCLGLSHFERDDIYQSNTSDCLVSKLKAEFVSSLKI